MFKYIILRVLRLDIFSKIFITYEMSVWKSSIILWKNIKIMINKKKEAKYNGFRISLYYVIELISVYQMIGGLIREYFYSFRIIYTLCTCGSTQSPPERADHSTHFLSTFLFSKHRNIIVCTIIYLSILTISLRLRIFHLCRSFFFFFFLSLISCA